MTTMENSAYFLSRPICFQELAAIKRFDGNGVQRMPLQDWIRTEIGDEDEMTALQKVEKDIAQSHRLLKHIRRHCICFG